MNVFELVPTIEHELVPTMNTCSCSIGAYDEHMFELVPNT